MLKKGGPGQFADLRGSLGKKEGGGVFEVGLIPQCTLWVVCNIFVLSFKIKFLNV